MKIFRFTNNASSLASCWQRSIASNCSLPCFNDDLAYILHELKNERKYWLFGFTRKQFIRACKTFKQQAQFCCDKSIMQWSPESKLITLSISKSHLYDFGDQVIFDSRKINQ